MEICVYYHQRTKKIIEILPTTIPSETKYQIEKSWTQDIPRKILISLSGKDNHNATSLKKEIGHSSSTIHENLKRLEESGLIETKVIYEGNKQRIIKSNVLCITRNSPQKSRLQRFFQGLWVDSKKTKKIIDFLNNNPTKYFTTHEIALKTNIPIDEVELLLNNWDSQVTRGLSDFLKECPFEKKVLYKGKK
ncbi:MAG: winged helix-turn-helix transcriptional regulator [Candidatus Woesearchaeota archaeon]